MAFLQGTIAPLPDEQQQQQQQRNDEAMRKALLGEVAAGLAGAGAVGTALAFRRLHPEAFSALQQRLWPQPPSVLERMPSTPLYEQAWGLPLEERPALVQQVRARLSGPAGPGILGRIGQPTRTWAVSPAGEVSRLDEGTVVRNLLTAGRTRAAAASARAARARPAAREAIELISGRKGYGIVKGGYEAARAAGAGRTAAVRAGLAAGRKTGPTFLKGAKGGLAALAAYALAEGLVNPWLRDTGREREANALTAGLTAGGLASLVGGPVVGVPVGLLVAGASWLSGGKKKAGFDEAKALQRVGAALRQAGVDEQDLEQAMAEYALQKELVNAMGGKWDDQMAAQAIQGIFFPLAETIGQQDVELFAPPAVQPALVAQTLFGQLEPYARQAREHQMELARLGASPDVAGLYGSLADWALQEAIAQPYIDEMLRAAQERRALAELALRQRAAAPAASPDLLQAIMAASGG